VSWDDVADLESGAQRDVRTTREHLSFQAADPQGAHSKTRQPGTKAMCASASGNKVGAKYADAGSPKGNAAEEKEDDCCGDRVGVRGADARGEPETGQPVLGLKRAAGGETVAILPSQQEDLSALQKVQLAQPFSQSETL
jgi:hypothetical protein